MWCSSQKVMRRRRRRSKKARERRWREGRKRSSRELDCSCNSLRTWCILWIRHRPYSVFAQTWLVYENLWLFSIIQASVAWWYLLCYSLTILFLNYYCNIVNKSFSFCVFVGVSFVVNNNKTSYCSGSCCQIKSWSGPSATKSENLFSESKNSRPRHGRNFFVDGPSTL